MRRDQLRASAVAIAASVGLVACGSAASGRVAAPRTVKPVRWSAFVHVRRPLDLAGPRPDGSIILAAAGRLTALEPTGSVAQFDPAYSNPGGEEPYIALSPGGHRRCSFGSDVVYALRLRPTRGVSAISSQGLPRTFARLTAPGLIDGITFDRTGAFGHRMLVTINAGSSTTVDAIDCHGTVTAITTRAPRIEGGIAVAPATFGQFAGDLIAPDETGGRIFAITPAGRSLLVARSGLPHGPDIGVESEAFVPRGPGQDALLADRLTPGNRHPGDDVVLRIRHGALAAAGVRSGDLLVATEGGARTDAISCGSGGCQVRHVADGPVIAHAEGHIVFAATV